MKIVQGCVSSEVKATIDHGLYEKMDRVQDSDWKPKICKGFQKLLQKRGIKSILLETDSNICVGLNCQ